MFKLILIYFFTIYLVICIVKIPVSNNFIISGNSMSGALQNGERVYAIKQKGNFKYGDIVIFKIGNKLYVKRIIGMPGNKITFGLDGYIYINDKKIYEKYISTFPKFKTKYVNNLIIQLKNYGYIIPDKMYVVLGDNRFNSLDSSYYGMIDEKQIYYKIIKNF